MKYTKGDYMILVDKIEGIGKRKGLFIGKGNRFIKVASFSSDEKAEKFIKWLEFFMCGPFDDPEDNEMELS